MFPEGERKSSDEQFLAAVFFARLILSMLFNPNSLSML